VFDLSIPKLLVLAVIALVVFGPNELPKIAAQAGRALRDLRQIAEGAMNDVRDGLGPELADFEIEDLNPKRFVYKHLFDDPNADQGARQQPRRQAAATGTPLTPGKHPPSGPDVTDLQGAGEAHQGDRPHGPGRGDHKGGTSPVRKKDL
jgi:sec-independent protein translocase protein TatB